MLEISPSKKHLNKALARDWSQAAHALFLNGLMREKSWNTGELVFHGGTNLHLCWQSARYSEDLDFLLARSAEQMNKSVAQAAKHVQEHFRRFDPDYLVSLKDRTKDKERMLVFDLVVSHPRVLGHAIVKVEFWRTDARYVKNYPTVLKSPTYPADIAGVISYPVPCATLQSAYADKLVAFATRPYLKWRDIYDLWWLGTQTRVEIDMEMAATQFLHNIQAYEPVRGLNPEDALVVLLELDPADVIRRADPDLKNWLPADLWKALYPQGIEQMVDYVRASLLQIHHHLKNTNTQKTIELNNPGQQAPAQPQ